ncbi:MAG: hypothetical protein WBZ51_04905, partial [Xanthobacteraceae bacterium]
MAFPLRDANRAPDIRFQVEQIYATNRFWPKPVISINPHFEQGPRRSIRRGANGRLIGTIRRECLPRSVRRSASM